MGTAYRHSLHRTVSARRKADRRSKRDLLGWYQDQSRPGDRSLNLANAVSVVVYEAWRQNGFAGAETTSALTSETPGADSFDQ